MKKAVFLPFLILCFHLSGQTGEQQQILDKTISKYREHTSVSYDVIYGIKYFDSEKPFVVISHVDMLKSDTDTLFHGSFMYSRKDSLSDLVKYYKPAADLLVIDIKKELVTRFDASKDQVFPVTGNVDGSVLETYFLDIEKLQRKVTNPVNKLSYSETETDLKVSIGLPDDEEYHGREEVIYIDKKTTTIRKITYRAHYQNQVQENYWLISNVAFDLLQQAEMDNRAGNYLKTFKTETYKPLTEADFKLLDKGTLAPGITGKIFPDYDRVISFKTEKILILDFWYTTCMPCIKTIPQLNRLREKYKNDIEILGVNPIESKADQKVIIEQFLTNTPMNYPILLADEVPEEYNVRGYPTLYVIDQQGKVLHAKMGFSENTYEELDKLIAKQLMGDSPNGTWKQQGYGRIIEVRDTLIKVYSVTKQSCQLSEEETLLDFGEIESCAGDTLLIRHGIDQWIFTRLDSLPELCASASELNKDPEYNFQVFWETFNENYPSFEIKGISWDSIYKTYKPRITKNTSELELYQVFSEMIAALHDGHVKMEVPGSIAKAYEDQTKKPKSKYSKFDEFELNKALADLYVDNLRSLNGGIIRYGTINNTIGYIQINAMLMLADYEISGDLDLKTFYTLYGEAAGKSKNEIQRQEEVAGANVLMTMILQQLKGVDAYILDLRFNGGGKDGAALAILNHFSPAEKTVFTKKAREENDFVNFQEIKVIPTVPRFTGNVYLLTSNQTASAAEILVLASRANPNFTKIGSTTEGIFSSVLDRKLPNGWEFELSNEVYQDLEGKNYENVGIPADFPFEYAKDKDTFFDQLSYGLKNKTDQAVELVIELEKKKN